MRQETIRRGLGRALRSIAIMLVGAQLLALYLLHYLPQLATELRPIQNVLMVTCFAFITAANAADQPQPDIDPREPSPRVAGLVVIATTGGVALLTLGTSSYLYRSLIALMTVAAAIATWRFATVHAGEIGEARFRTRSAGE